jgi:hypothetical protein
MQRRKLHPAFKHGAYCTSSLLPGEDVVVFERLLQDLVKEFAPTGALEEDIVETIARLVWRKRHLETYRSAEIARNRYSIIETEKRLKRRDVPELETMKAAAAQVRTEFGDTYDSVMSGKTPTFDLLLGELAVEERLDALVEKCLKRLALVRAVKSLTLSPSAVVAPRSSPDQDQPRLVHSS